MSLEDFRYSLMKLSQLDGSDIPSYTVSKDLFDQIDLKKDGIIDKDEWLHAFVIIYCQFYKIVIALS